MLHGSAAPHWYCLSVAAAGGLIRDFATDIYYGKPRPTNLDMFTKALLHRDLQIYEERKHAESKSVGHKHCHSHPE